MGEFGRLAFRGRTGLGARIVNFEKQYCIAFHDDLPKVQPAINSPGYVIFAPDYSSTSAGICCLYRLCDELNRRGYPAYITGSGCTNPVFKAPLIGRAQAQCLCMSGFTAVYSEVVFGNPLGAKIVARWVLNQPGLLGGDEQYEDSELIFCYSDVYSTYIKNHVAGKLFMPTIDESIFYSDDRDGSTRTLECYYVGKSSWKDGYVDRKKAFEITRTTPAKSELGELFRKAKVLYCFDNSTILVYEAILCGCPVVVIPDGTQTKEDYDRLELGRDGIAWGVGELDKVRADVPKLHERYERVKRDYVAQLESFIDITQRRAA
jgi:hypothetical protein